ncbi:MAG: tetratricopeptide repeat protein [Desulfovibrionaceae bacterium]
MSAKASQAPRTGMGPLLMALLLGAGAVVMLIASVHYRMENPSMTMTMRQQGPEDQMRSAAMERVSELMVQAQEDPADRATQVELGELFFRMGSYENAEVFLARAMKLDPSDKDVLRLYGMTLFHRENYEGAAKAFQAMIELNPEDPAPHYNLGVLQKHFLEQPEAAAGHFRKVVEMAPEDSEMREKARQELDSVQGGD